MKSGDVVHSGQIRSSRVGLSYVMRRIVSPFSILVFCSLYKVC